MSEATIEAIDNALHDWSVSGDAMRWTPDADAHRRERMTRLANPIAFRFDPRPFQAALTKMARELAKMVKPMMAFAERISHRLPDHSKARCPKCSPRANPIALCIDGREYHRRRRARRRR